MLNGLMSEAFPPAQVSPFLPPKNEPTTRSPLKCPDDVIRYGELAIHVCISGGSWRLKQVPDTEVVESL